MKISKRFANVGDSSTLKITAKAKAMKASGEDVAILAAGEPDFDTPACIKEAAINAINEGYTGYTPVKGIAPLRELIAGKFRDENRINYSPDEIAVTVGAKQALYNVLQSVCDEESDVIIIAPYWVSYIEMVKMTGATPVVYDTSDDDFKLVPEKIEQYITSRTRMIILNSPSNPSGVVYSKDALIKLSEIIVRNNIYCISDEIYEKIIYPGAQHFSIASVNDEIRKRTFTVNGFSKAYAMTGWRIGYIGAERALLNNAVKVQTHSTSCTSSIAQHAAIAALKSDPEIVKKMVEAFDKRREYIMKRIDAIDGIDYVIPRGAFYIFMNMKKLIDSSSNSIESSEELCIRLLDDHSTALIPGSAFGCNDYVRLSYAASMEEIEKGADRLEQFVKKNL